MTTQKVDNSKSDIQATNSLKKKLGSYIKSHIADLSRVIALAILFFALVILSPKFAGITNLLNVLRVASLNLILATGIALCMLVSGIDLSVGSVIALTTIMFAQLFQEGRSILEMAYCMRATISSALSAPS